MIEDTAMDSTVGGMESKIKFYLTELEEEKRLLIAFINNYIDLVVAQASSCISEEKPNLRQWENSLSSLQKAVRSCLYLRQQLLYFDSTASNMNDDGHIISFKPETQANRTRGFTTAETSSKTGSVSQHSTETLHANGGVKTFARRRSSRRNKFHQSTNSEAGLLQRAFRWVSLRRKKRPKSSESTSTLVLFEEDKPPQLHTNAFSTLTLDTRYKTLSTEERDTSMEIDDVFLTARHSFCDREIIQRLEIENPSLTVLQEDSYFVAQGNGNKKNDSEKSFHEDQASSSLVISNPSLYSYEQSRGRNSVNFRIGENIDSETIQRQLETSVVQTFEPHRQIGRFKVVKMSYNKVNENKLSPGNSPIIFPFIENTDSEILIQEDQTTISSSLVISNPSLLSHEQSRGRNSVNFRIENSGTLCRHSETPIAQMPEPHRQIGRFSVVRLLSFN